MQGNWGNIYTGDKSAAARYIEVRLTQFALDVVFNSKITNGTHLMMVEVRNLRLYQSNFHYY